MPPHDIEILACRCKDRCATKRCACRKWGGRCKHDCKCSEGVLGLECINPFERRLDEFFGDRPHVRANACFVKVLEKSDRGARRSSYPTVGELETLLMRDKTPFTVGLGDLGMADWFKQLPDFQLGSKERAEHMQSLFRRALGEGQGAEYSEWFYSFCRNGWEEDNMTTHCWACNDCKHWREWHCGVCKQCQYGLSIPCEGCGGRSNMVETYDFETGQPLE